ncbi:MAG: hypothetical protein GXP22_07195 [Gammaproteobacteria bacterium]|nr:hypothetical protein [Gammaproteobacteria bacterium]
MILNVLVSDQAYSLDVPDEMMAECEEFFAGMDKDMDKGWQMSSRWVEDMNLEQRCQVAADRILSAMDNHNKDVATMMAGYILSRVPQVAGVRMNMEGEMFEHELLSAEQLQTSL